MRPKSVFAIFLMFSIISIPTLSDLHPALEIIVYTPIFLGFTYLFIFPDINDIQRKKLGNTRQAIRNQFKETPTRCDVCGDNGISSFVSKFSSEKLCGLRCLFVTNSRVAALYWVLATVSIITFIFEHFSSLELTQWLRETIFIVDFIFLFITLAVFENDQIDRLYRYVPDTFEEFEAMKIQSNLQETHRLQEEYETLQKLGKRYEQSRGQGTFARIGGWIDRQIANINEMVIQRRHRGMVKVEELGWFRICCNQTARLGENYCQCGRAVPQKLHDYYTM